MKRPFIILLLLFPLSTFGQTKLEGTFCTPTDYVGYCLTFRSDSLFDYSSWSCMSSEKGNGTYKIDKKKLTLSFISNDSLRNSSSFVGNDALKNSFTVKETNCNTTDSITLNFLVTDRETSEPLPFANIWLTGIRKDTTATWTDFNGNATLKIKNPTKEFEITVSYVGYERFSINIKSDNCKDLKINLTSSSSFNNKIENGTKWEYKIKKVNTNILILRQDKFDKTFTRQKE